MRDVDAERFAVLDSPRCGRAAAEEGLYSFEAIDQVLLLRRHLLRFLPRLHFKVLLHVRFNVFYIIKAMSIRELTWQIKLVVLEATNLLVFSPVFTVSV